MLLFSCSAVEEKLGSGEPAIRLIDHSALLTDSTAGSNVAQNQAATINGTLQVVKPNRHLTSIVCYAA